MHPPQTFFGLQVSVFGYDEIARQQGNVGRRRPEAPGPAAFSAFIITHPSWWSNEFESGEELQEEKGIGRSANGGAVIW
jgi:hypothetical protein